MIRTHFLFLISFFSVNVSLHAADTISGNANNTTETFTFPIHTHIFDQKAGIFFAGANSSQNNLGIAQNFALTQLKRTGTAFEPLAPSKARVNSSVVDNPLFDAGIEFLSLVSGPLTMGQGRPLVVKTGELASVYLIDSFFNTKNIVMVKEGNVPDTTGAVTSGIVGLTGSNISFAFAAVKPTAGGNQFGDVGSGIAEFILGIKADTKQRLFGLLDAPTGNASATPHALPLDVTSSVVKITNDIANMGQVVSMHWDESIQRLFIGLQVTAGAGGTDGARAVVVGRLNKNKALILSPIAPDAALAGTDKIVGATGTSVQVSANQIKSMFTSTALHYLIVQGGNGAPAATRRTVFALPLVSGSSAEVNGTIANKLSSPEDTFESKIPFRFLRRDIKNAATAESHMTTSTDPAAMIGAGPLAAGDIDEIFVRSDAVFAVVGTPDTNQKPGIFTSQALFDESGKIKAWTQWQRVAGTTDQIYGAALDAYQGNFISMVGTDIDSTATVKRTNWSNGATLRSLSNIISLDFPQSEGGIHKLFDFSSTNGTTALHNSSLLIATGLKKILLVESGQVINNVLNPFTGNYIDTLEKFTNGTITKTFPNGAGDPKAVEISGGVLDDIGPINSATIAQDDMGANLGYLFVGGAGGIAVLSQPNGDGWDTTTGLGPDFKGITAGMSFKKVGSYSLVRKIIWDGDYLYVLTENKLDRIDLTAGGIGLGNITPVTIADLTLLAGHPNASFLDCIVSEKFALIATSFGLLRVGNGNDIRIAISPTDVGWCTVPNPEWPNNAQQIIAVSKTGRPQDVARYDGGHIYVLNAYRGKQRSQINRFEIKAVDGANAIDDNTIQPLPDIFVKDRLSYLMNYGQLRPMFATDGAMYFGARDRDLAINPQVIVPSTATPPQSGYRFVGVKGVAQLPVNISAGNNVTTLLRNFASGSWLISGDFGLQINE